MLIQIGQEVPSIGGALQDGCFSMGSCVISWFSKNQSCVTLSTAEAEYVTACSASCEIVWLKKLLSDIFDLQLYATCIHCDNQCFMTGQSISRSSITISGIWCKEEQ